jgi:hypothetical protein
MILLTCIMMIKLSLVPTIHLLLQDRNEHNYLADFDSESDLYLRSHKIMEHLAQWQPSTTSLQASHPLCACIEELWIAMYERNYIQEGDVVLVQVWLQSLLTVGYKFPLINPQSTGAKSNSKNNTIGTTAKVRQEATTGVKGNSSQTAAITTNKTNSVSITNTVDSSVALSASSNNTSINNATKI